MNPVDIVLAILLALTIGAGAWLGLHMLTQTGKLMIRLELLERQLVKQGLLQDHPGLPPGTVLNNFALPLLGGGTMTLAEWRGRKLVLIYLSTSCSHCVNLVPSLAAALPAGKETDPAAMIMTSGGQEANVKMFAEHRPGCPIVVQEGTEVSSLHGASATPMAYLLDESGAITARAALGGEAVLALLRGEVPAAEESAANGHTPRRADPSLANSRINRDGLKAGTPAPEFTLPALDGSEISLASYRGRRVLLVFSDPQCGPCNELLPKLEKLHRGEGPEVLLIGRGEREVNQEKARTLGLTFPIVLQRSWEISRAYAMFATPIGYLVGEDGVLVEDVAVGGNAILALAARQRSGIPVGT